MSDAISVRFGFPWYKKGLSFSCTQCGQCCTGSPGFVFVTNEEINWMAAFLNIDAKTFKRLYLRRIGQRHALVEKKSDNHSCVFYRERRCSVYAVRPLQCRTYPFWQENLLSEKAWEETAKVCEGIHPQAPLVPLEVIEESLQAQREQGPEEHFVSQDSGSND